MNSPGVGDSIVSELVSESWTGTPVTGSTVILNDARRSRSGWNPVIAHRQHEVVGQPDFLSRRSGTQQNPVVLDSDHRVVPHHVDLPGRHLTTHVRQDPGFDPRPKSDALWMTVTRAPARQQASADSMAELLPPITSTSWSRVPVSLPEIVAHVVRLLPVGPEKIRRVEGSDRDHYELRMIQARFAGSGSGLHLRTGIPVDALDSKYVLVQTYVDVDVSRDAAKVLEGLLARRFVACR